MRQSFYWHKATAKNLADLSYSIAALLITDLWRRLSVSSGVTSKVLERFCRLRFAMEGKIKDTHRLGAPTSAERHNNYTRLRHNKRPL